MKAIEKLANAGGQKNMNNDLKIGLHGEGKVVKILEKHLDLKFLSYNESSTIKGLKEYDLSFIDRQGNEVRIEVKTDVYGKRSNNIVFEKVSRKKPSGISTTKADYWVNFFYHKDEIWLFAVSELKEIIKMEIEKNYEGDDDAYMDYCYGGDNDTSFMYRAPVGPLFDDYSGNRLTVLDIDSNVLNEIHIY